ncbi:hypothetical protein GGX14DRAFT_392085 [Mycena pura]|uniref:Uncharacterized protein n=1 Tax=Mycena pura TaxID=153505 RepID=A0AAD6VJB4_9AGAR|nr:hypothetical protein GGX14DRAFT_392085 [Mycena pura]
MAVARSTLALSQLGLWCVFHPPITPPRMSLDNPDVAGMLKTIATPFGSAKFNFISCLHRCSSQEASDLLIMDNSHGGNSDSAASSRPSAASVCHLRARRVAATVPRASHGNLQPFKWKTNTFVNSVHLLNKANTSWNVLAPLQQNASTSWSNASTSWHNTSTSSFPIPCDPPSTFLGGNERPLELGNAAEGTRQVLCTRCRQYVGHSFVTGSTPMLKHLQGSKCLLAADATPVMSHVSLYAPQAPVAQLSTSTSPQVQKPQIDTTLPARGGITLFGLFFKEIRKNLLVQHSGQHELRNDSHNQNLSVQDNSMKHMFLGTWREIFKNIPTTLFDQSNSLCWD